ncbi:MAG: hypothetical protein QNJ94_04255 [Alphaproteobacteria bacterium]|nr:hypothetical protein [Alphaproteobacteria bacterium]
MTKAAPSSISASRLARALALTAALLLAIDQGAGVFLDYVYGRSSKSPVARIAMVAPETLILGSSTGRTAIDPASFLPGAYNASENGQGLFYVASVLRNLPDLPQLKRVVVAFDPAEFTTGYRSSTFKQLRRHTPLARQDPMVRDWVARGDPWAWLKFRSGLYPYRGGADSVIEGWYKPRLNGNGFLPLKGSQVQEVSLAEDRSPPEPVLPEAQRALDAIAVSGRRLGVQLIAVVTPMAGQLRDRSNRFSPAMKTIHAAFAGNGNCDLTRDPDSFLDAFARRPDYFWEGPHLNAKGAAVYSRWLAERIVQSCPKRD